jgi:signal transduction histidine kinase
MKYLTLVIIALSLCATTAAQKRGQELIDSLANELPKQKEDTNKVLLYSKIARAFWLFDIREAIVNSKKGLELAEKIQWKKGIANSNNEIGLFLSDTGNHALAREYLEKSLVLNTELGSKINQINNLNNIVRSYQRESNFSKAIDYLGRALTVAQDLGNPEKIAMVCTNITAIFYVQRNFAKAKEYSEMTLKYGELANSPEQIGKALSNLGLLKMEVDLDSAGAKDYMNRAFKVYEGLNNKQQMAGIYANMAQLEYPHYQKMLDKMQKAQAIYDEISPFFVGSIGNLCNMGNIYYEWGGNSQSPQKEIYFKNAEDLYKRGIDLCNQASNTEYLATFYLSQSDLAEARGNYKESLHKYKEAMSINDSLFSQDKKNELAGMEGKYQLALKDNEIAINKLEISNTRRMQFGLLAGLLLAGIIAIMLYRQSLSRKRTNTTLMVLNNQLDEANKVKARFFGILSHDLRSPIANLMNFLQLQKDEPGLLSEEQRVRGQQKISKGAEDLLHSMEAMLLWSKEQMKDFKPDIKEVAVSELFENVQKFFSQVDKVSIRFHAEPGLTILTDENYLQVIMQNLTSNAIKALKNTTDAAVEWTAKNEGGKTYLTITDNGPGMRDEHVKALYEENSSLNAKSGFGFHLIRDLARAIQYKISFQSQPGMGTTFVLSA